MEPQIISNHMPILYSFLITLLTIFVLNIKKKRDRKKRLQLVEEAAERRRRAQETIANLARNSATFRYKSLGNLRRLPKDIIYNILARLPLPALAQMRCLNKSWNKLLMSVEFNHFHLHNQNQQQYFLKIWQSRDEVVKNSYLLCFSCEDLTEKLEIVKVTPNGHYVVVDISNGLVCLRSMDDMSKEYVLLNPLTKEFRSIPSPNPSRGGSSKLHDPACNAFGFVQEKYDYKILKVERRFGKGDKICFKYLVYSLSTGSWKQARMDSGVGYDVKNGYSPHIRGCFHLMAYNCSYYDEQPYIITFDLKNETLGTLPCPRDVSRLFTKMCVWKNHLAVITFDYKKGSGFKTIYSLWVMKQYGNGDSWTRISVTPHIDFCSYGGVAKNGKLLFHQSMDYFLYNIDTETTLGPHRIFGYLENGPALCYESSLVTFGGRYPEPKVLQKRRKREESPCFLALYGSMFALLFVLYFLLLMDGYFKRYIMMLLPATKEA